MRAYTTVLLWYPGGAVGFDRKLWDVQEGIDASLGEAPYLKLTYTSPSGEEGFPGEVLATVRYTLVGKGNVAILFLVLWFQLSRVMN